MKQNLFHLFRFTSPGLPIGAFAYSQGLESAIELGWIKNDKDVKEWILGLMTNTMPYTDLAILKRLAQAKLVSDKVAFKYWNDTMLACRESKELLQEDIQLGKTFKRLLLEVEEPEAEEAGTLDLLGISPLSYVSVFSLALINGETSERDLLSVYLWTWLENLVAAAIKLVPLGQTDGQRVLKKAMQNMPACIDTALAVDDDDIGAGAPGFAIASSIHETQYSRLFRS